MLDEFEIGKVAVAPLKGVHDLNHFVCRLESLQNFCRQPLEDANASYALRAFVAIHDGDPRILGYYHLSLSTVGADEVGKGVEGRFLHLPAIPTIYLGMLAVDRRVERRGVGKLLMADALARTATIARHAGTYALTLDAIDAEAAAYYEDGFDFQRFMPGGLKMYLAIQTIIALDLPDPA